MFLQFIPALEPVAVHPDDPGVRKLCPDFVFHKLRAEADVADVERTAAGALVGRFNGIAAVVAFEAVVGLMVGERNGTVPAFELKAAAVAAEKIREAPPV